MQKILLVEDEKIISDSLLTILKKEGFAVDSAMGQRETIQKLENQNLLLVDLAIADGDGFGVCREAKKRNLPVIFLTASGDENSVVRGLDMGADDYIAKPFRPRELISRIRSVLRRYGQESCAVTVGDLTVNLEKGSVCKNGEMLSLSALEYRLLTVFVNNRGKLLTRDQLLADIWDVAGDFVNDNTLTVYIKRLREKIETDAQSPEIIKTVRGMGYRMD